MSLLKNRIKATEKKYQRRKSRVNTKIKATQPEYRLVLQKSLLYVSAQLLDRDAKVVASISDKGMKGKTKTERAKLAGEELAKNIKKAKIDAVTVDRNGFSYQGRIQAFVEGVRAGGVVC
ncbi:MAG: 50S ribosomal protein L18 [candidate division SR1 bacterium]|nr:MAG: 50S ribosomal protein L18 [candidate division SR1 bacterium]